MKILEVKNNLVKMNYDTSSDNLILSGFVVIKDVLQSFIGQIIHLESSADKSVAIVKLLFTFDDQGVITSYNGAIPSAQNDVETVDSQELLGLLPNENPIFMGELAQQKIALSLDKKIFEDKLLVCCENESNKEILSENFVSQLLENGNKVLVLDLSGNLGEKPLFASSQIIAGKDFKLPLNYESINFIYEKGLEDASLETKALIQEVFLEVQNYVKTLPEKFIPFETFKNVVDSQYEESELVELLLLKNKLLKYYDEGVFAQTKEDFNSFETSIKSQNLTVLNLSDSEEKIQREILSYIYSIISNADEKIYILININDEISDKKLLKRIFTTKNAFSIIFAEYSYKYLKELKQLSKNLILFAPIQQQNDFASYNVFLNKINSNEFIVYGQSTQHMPLIVKLEKLSQKISEPVFEQEEILQEPLQIEEPSFEELPIDEGFLSQDSLLDEEIKQDVDEIYLAPKNEDFEAKYQEDEEFNIEVISEDDGLTDADLDFIEEEFSETKENEEIIEDEETVIEAEEIPQEESLTEFSQEIEDEAFELPNESFSDVMLNEAQAEQTPAPISDILPADMASTPIVPIYSADVESTVESDELTQGDIIAHPKYGKGVVEKMISYGNKKLCSINFDNVGRRLLDPNLAELKKI